MFYYPTLSLSCTIVTLSLSCFTTLPYPITILHYHYPITIMFYYPTLSLSCTIITLSLSCFTTLPYHYLVVPYPFPIEYPSIIIFYYLPYQYQSFPEGEGEKRAVKIKYHTIQTPLHFSDNVLNLKHGYRLFDIYTFSYFVSVLTLDYFYLFALPVSH